MNTENLLINAEQILAMALHGLLALVGGIARELGRISQGFSWPRFISGAFISIFAGIVVYFLCQVYSDSQWFTAAATSLAGYIGAPMLDALAHVIKTKLNIKEDVNLLATPEPITNEKKTKKVKQAKKK